MADFPAKGGTSHYDATDIVLGIIGWVIIIGTIVFIGVLIHGVVTGDLWEVVGVRALMVVVIAWIVRGFLR